MNKLELDFDKGIGTIPSEEKVPSFAIAAKIEFELTPENTLEAYDLMSERLIKNAANTNTQPEQDA